MSSLYSFPILKLSEIFLFMRETKVHVSEEDIKNCDPAAVRRFFEFFLEIILGVGKEDLSQPALSGLGALQYPSLHEDSIPELAFFRMAKKVMTTCGVHDFSWSDIQRPNLKRLRRQLSAMINFSKFKQERKAHFDQFNKTAESLVKARQQAEEENAKLRRKLEELKTKREQEAPAIQALTEECNELEVEINTINEGQAQFRPQLEAKKNQVKELVDAYNSQRVLNMDAKKMIDNMTAKIINSPARLKSEVTEIAQQMDEAREVVDAVNGRTGDLQGIHDTISRAVKETQNVVQLLEAIDSDILNKTKEEKENLRLVTQQIESFASKAKNAMAHKARVEKIIQQRRDQLEAYKQQARTKMQAAEHALASAAKELKQMRESMSSKEQQTAATLQAAQEAHAKINSEREAYELKLKDMEETFIRMERKVKAYSNMITDIIEA